MAVLSSIRPTATAAVRAGRAFSTTSRTSDFARMHLIGRLGGDPVQKTTKNGKDYLIYKVATTDPLAPSTGETPSEPTTSWHTIFAYGPACERLSKLEKGTLVHVDASFSLTSAKTESGDYTTNIFAKHERLHVIKKPTAKED